MHVHLASRRSVAAQNIEASFQLHSTVELNAIWAVIVHGRYSDFPTACCYVVSSLADIFVLIES